MKTSHLIGLLALCIAILIPLLLVIQKTIIQPQQQSLTAGHVVIQGTMLCLPHKDSSGPQTTECAFGLKDDTGRYFGLSDADPQYGNISSKPMNSRVEVEGEFTPRTDSKYQDVGVIAVTRVDLADVPKRASLSGVLECLPLRDVAATSTESVCRHGILTADGTHYALDLALMSQAPPEMKIGDTVSGEGVVVDIRQLDTPEWQAYNIAGIFSVTDSLKVKN